MNPDRLAELEEERRFLLRSLADLEREHDAGDVDEHDYLTLRDGYTARAAATIRAIDAGRDALPDAPPANWPRRVGIVAVTAVLIGVVWWVLADSSAQRLAGQEITGGDPRSEIEILRAQARSIQFEQPAAAAAMYDEILAREPDDVNALTYGGWTRALGVAVAADEQTDAAAQLTTATEMLSEAIRIDPDYPDPYCLRGVVLARFLDRPDAAEGDLERCLAGNPPADIADLVSGFVAGLDEPDEPGTDG